MSKNTHEADVAFVKALAELLRENELTELEVKREYGEDDSLNIRVSRATMAAPIVPRKAISTVSARAQNTSLWRHMALFQKSCHAPATLPRVSSSCGPNTIWTSDFP